MAADQGETFISTSKGMCRECGKVVEARYVADASGVYLERRCPDHGKARALVAETLAWYLSALQSPVDVCPPPRVLQARTHACPQSCGPCAFHGQKANLPVFSITNACELRCPICFTYNREDQLYFMGEEEFRRHIDFVLSATGGVDLINITGGEPTLHPQLLRLLELARREGIGRITMNTNGLTLARDEGLAQALSELGVYVILSLDTLQPEVSQEIHGADITTQKQKALQNLQKYDVQTTLLHVLIGGVNELELPQILDLALGEDFIRSLTIQTMTYTGQGGRQFGPRAHIPVEGVERRLEEASRGRIRRQDFTPLPTAHPLCYGVNYLLKDAQGGLCSLTELLGREVVARHLGQGYLLHPGEKLEAEMRLAIDRLWSERRSPAVLKAVKDMLKTLYPPQERLSIHERQRRAEERVKTIYVHAHMDEDTWEVGRAMRCPDQVPVNAEKLIGACNYNLFYRMKDERFWVQD